jgi:proline dehydrogenase
MVENGISLKDSRVHFAQLMGMCDHLSYALKEFGVNSCKLFPFGPVHEVMPYMIRRMQENEGFMSSTYRERQLLAKEIKRRLTPSF